MSLTLELNLGSTSLRITGKVFLREEGFGRAGVLEGLAELAPVGELSLISSQSLNIGCLKNSYVNSNVLIVDIWGMARLPKTIPTFCQAKQVRGMLECFEKLAWVILYPSCQSIVTGSLGLGLC